MAARKTQPTKLQQEQTRMAIKTTQLVKRLQNYALGESEANATDPDAPAVDLDSGKLKAIEILLRKSLPDLSAVTLTGDNDADPINVKEVGQGAAKLAAALEQIAERRGTSGEPSAE